MGWGCQVVAEQEEVGPEPQMNAVQLCADKHFTTGSATVPGVNTPPWLISRYRCEATELKSWEEMGKIALVGQCKSTPLVWSYPECRPARQTHRAAP